METDKVDTLNGMESVFEKLKNEDGERQEHLETLKNRLLGVGLPMPNGDGSLIKLIYIQILEFLLDEVNSKWCRQLNSANQSELFDAFFFIEAFLADSVLFLVRMVDECSLSKKLDKTLYLVEHIVTSPSILGQLFLRQCTIGTVQREFHSDLWKDLVTGFVSLPDRIANKYHRQKAPNAFNTDVYFNYMLKCLIWCLQGLHRQIISRIDCSMQFISMILGRSCLAGNAESIIPALTDFLCRVTLNDFVWRRISQKLFSNLPDNTVESVLTCLFRRCRWSKALSRLLGNSMLDNKRQQFLITNKLLLIRTFDDDRVLHNIIGYLADEDSQKKNYIKVSHL